MPGAVAASVGRATELAEVASRSADMQRDRAVEAARAQTDKAVATANRPQASVRLDTERAVDVASSSVGSQSLSARRPALSADIRSMMMGGAETQQSQTNGGAQLISRLLDALRAYKKQYG